MRVPFAKLLLTLGVLIAGASALQGVARAGSPNGVAGRMPAYYDHELFTINFFQLTTAQATLLTEAQKLQRVRQDGNGGVVFRILRQKNLFQFCLRHVGYAWLVELANRQAKLRAELWQ